MHVPTAPALILGGLLAVAALDLGVVASHQDSPTASRLSAPALAPAASSAAAPPAVVRPPLPHAAPPKAAPVVHRSAAPRPRRGTGRVASRPRLRVEFSAGTTQADLDGAVRRLRGYQPGTVRWVLSSQYGRWGTADWYANVVYISPKVPYRLLRSVVIHEWDHILSVRAYGGDVSAAVTAMNQYFGGSGLSGAERAADCMAIISGATWTHYTTCVSHTWRAGAELLLQGRRL